MPSVLRTWMPDQQDSSPKQKRLPRGTIQAMQTHIHCKDTRFLPRVSAKIPTGSTYSQKFTATFIKVTPLVMENLKGPNGDVFPPAPNAAPNSQNHHTSTTPSTVRSFAASSCCTALQKGRSECNNDSGRLLHRLILGVVK